MTYWPASSSTTPRYAGPVSFFRLPTLSNPAEADIALIGLPYDGGTTNRSGTRHGPREMRAMSMFIRPFHHVTKTSPYTTHRVADFGDCPMNPPCPTAPSTTPSNIMFSGSTGSGAVPAVGAKFSSNLCCCASASVLVYWST
jgi:guanidinopropionase